MKRRIILISSTLLFGALCALIAWYATKRIELKVKWDAHSRLVGFLEDHEKVLLDKKMVPEEMYEVGRVLYQNAWYNEADQILRFVVMASEKDEWSEWGIRARNVLLSDDFQAFYESGVAVSNTLSTELTIDVLFGKGSVVRKYGQPDEVIKNKDYPHSERWLYGLSEDHTIRFDFIDNRTYGMIEQDSDGKVRFRNYF